MLDCCVLTFAADEEYYQRGSITMAGIKNPILCDRSIFIITGIMAAGKSTVAQLLAERFERGVHVRGDVFRRMVVSGRVEMTPEAGEEAFRQLNLRYQLAAHAADVYCSQGFHVVVQDNIYGRELQDFVNMIHGRPLFVVALCPRHEVVAKREAARPKKGYGEWSVESLDRIFRNETPRIGLWLDSSDLTPEQTVDEILKRVWTEGRLE
jgi:chloramphenicol 3-O-phosphotransferase